MNPGIGERVQNVSKEENSDFICIIDLLITRVAKSRPDNETCGELTE